MRSIHSWLRGLVAASALFAGVCSAQTFEHGVYLDLDNNAATGCNVATPAGAVNGVEVRVSATVTGTPPMVTASTRAQCAGGVFGPAAPQGASYAVGLNNGSGGADVVELGTSLAGLGNGGPARLVFVSSGGGGADLASGQLQLPGGGTLSPTDPITIPATGIVALLVAVGLVLLLARRHPGFASSAVVLLVLGAGVAWAANFVVDGQVGDWAGVAPLATDPANDPTNGDAHIDVVAVFAAVEGGNLFLRTDVRDAQAPGNNAPVANDANFTLAENAAAGTPVGTVVATDADAGQSLTYSITAGNAAGAFAINASTGAITVANAAPLDFEATPSFTLTVTVTDNFSAPASDTATVIVTLTDANEAPVLADATRAVAEDSAAGTAVGAPLAGSDPDAGDPPSTWTYTITAGNTGGAFAISNTGQITVANAAQVANLGTFTLTVVLSDDGGLSDSATVTINVTDQNDAPQFTNPPYAFSLPENSANGTVVGNAPATDSDVGQVLTYAITGGNVGGAFAISNSGQVTVANVAALNLEDNPVFTLQLGVTDNGAPPLSANTTATITLTDVNEAPVATDATFAVAENAAVGTSVGTVVATDPDLDPPNPPSANATLTYAITGGSGQGVFAIDAGTGVITTTAAMVLANSPYSLTVTVTDGGTPGLADTAAISIVVTDQNDAPTLADTSFSVSENSSSGTTVGVLAATDPDAGQAFTYAITAGNGAGAFAIDAASGTLTVANAAALDFETTPGFTLTVSVTDNGTPPLGDTAQVTITLTDANDAPVANDAAFTLAENAAVGTVVGTYTATDPDAGQVLTYAITGGTGQGLFAINPTTGQVTVSESNGLDFETTPTRTLVITALDNGASNLSDTATITVTLTDVNEAPVAADAAFTVLENSAAGTVVGTVTATDVDAGANGNRSFAITGGNTNNAFAISAATGVLTVATQAEMDFGNSYSLVVTVTDGGTPGLTDTATIAITVDDVNEAPAPSATPASPITITEGVAIGSTVTTIAPNDPEAGQSHTYSIQSGNTGNAFAVSAAGVVTVAAALDFETLASYSLVIRVTDNGTPALFADLPVTMLVSDANEAPVVSAGGTLSYAEGDGARTLDTGVTVSDPDAGEGIESATVQVAANYSAGQDLLALPATAGIAGNFNPASGTLTLTGSATPAAWQAALRTVTYENTSMSPTTAPRTVAWRVNDGALASNFATSAITINAVNSVPTITSTIPPGATEDVPYVYTPTFTDADGPGQAWTLDAANTCAGATVNPATGQYAFTPAGPVPAASCTVAIHLCDTGTPNQCVSQSAGITIAPVNDAPAVASTAPTTATEDQPYSYAATASDPDGPGQAWALRAGHTCGGSIGAGTGLFSFTPAGPNPPATCVLDIEVCDNGTPNLCGSETRTITITPVNSAPVIDSTPPPAATEDQAYTYNATRNDPDGPGATWSLTAANTCAGASIDGSSGAYTFTPAGPTPPASCDIGIQVCDGGAPALCGTQVRTIAITAQNDAPTITNNAPITATEDTPYGFTAAVVDPDGPSVTWSTTVSNTCGGGIDAATGAYAFTPAGPNPPATCVVGLQACDNGTPDLCATRNTTVTIVPVNDAPSIVAPGAQSTNEDVNRVFSTGNGNAITVADADANASPIVVTLGVDNGTLDATNAGGATIGGDLSNSVTITGTVTQVNAALAGLAFRPAANYFGPATLTIGVDDQGATGGGALGANATVAITVVPVNDAPVATGKTHATHSGIGLTIDAAPHTGELIEGATDVDDAPGELTVQLVAGSSSQAEAQITLTNATDGSFRYDPPGGYTGAATFQYRICDDNTGDANQCSAPATVTVNVGGVQTWFVDDTDAAGCGAACTGSLARPLVGLANGDAQFVVRGTGDSLFVFSGTYAAGHSVAASERFVGQGASNIQGALNHTYTSFTNGTLGTLPASGAAPVIGPVALAGNDASARGVAINATATVGLSAVGVTGVAVSETSVASTGQAIQFTSMSTTAGITLSSTSSSGGTNGIALSNTAGTIALGTGSLTGQSAVPFVGTGTLGTVTYAGTITKTNAGNLVEFNGVAAATDTGSATLSGNLSCTAACSGIDVVNRDTGTITFSGASKVLNTGANTAVNLDNNDTATIAFTGGGLDIDTTTGNGFHAVNGATGISVTGTGNATLATVGVALNILDSTIGASEITFERVDAGTAAASAGNGIVLQNTGSVGGVEVSGIPGTGGSGGTIRNKTGADGATAGTGIWMENTMRPRFSNMQLNDFSNYAVRGRNVSGLQFSRNVVNGSNGDNAATPFNEGSLAFFGVTGTSSGLTGNSVIQNNTITGGHQRNIAIDNSVGTLDLSVTGNTIRRSSDAAGDDGFFLEADTTANVTVAITGNTFERHGGDHVNITAVNNAVVAATVQNNILHGNYAGTPAGNHPIGLGQGIFLFGANFNGSMPYVVSNNGTAGDPFRGNRQGGAIHVNKGSGTATVTGNITGNVIGAAATVGSGSSESFGIIVGSRGAGGSHGTRIDVNQVRQYFDRGIVSEAGEGAAALNATIINNTIDNFADAVNSLHGLHADNGILAGDTNLVCLQVQGNTATNAGNEAAGGADLRLRRGSNTTVRIPGLAGTSAANVQTLWQGQNTATSVTVTGTTFSGGAACPTP